MASAASDARPLREAEAARTIAGRDIVCVSFGAWDDLVETPQYLMTRLAKRNRVLFVDQPVSPVAFLSGIRSRASVSGQIARWRRGVRQVAENLYAGAPPPVLPRRANKAVNLIDGFVIRRWLGAQARRLGFRDPIYWNFQPWFPDLGRAVAPTLSIYYCVDDFPSAPYAWNRGSGMRRREEECCREADIVICTGRNLVATRKAYNPNTHFMPEGADVELFARATLPGTPVPEEIGRLPGKIIGYTGAINWRVDVDLLVHLATKQPEWSLVLIGPIKPDAEGFDRLAALPNVHLLGSKHVSELPPYVKGMDVCLIPYVLNEYTHHIFPLKLYEYMAAGKPIVTTDIAEMRPYAGEAMTVARSHEEFRRAVADAIAHDSLQRRAARREAAVQHSWEHRIDEIGELIAPLLDGRARSDRPVGEVAG